MVKLGIGDKSLLIITLLIISYSILQWQYAAALTAVILIAVWLNLRNYYTIFKRLGLNGPKPSLLTGNIAEVHKDSGFHKIQIEWEKKYGKIYGAFPIGLAEITISDLDILRDILVKDFTNFINRLSLRDNADDLLDTSLFNQMLLIITDDNWRRVRHASSPAFTPAKLKQMIPLILKCIQSNLERLEHYASRNEKFNIRNHCGAFILDTILAAVFGKSVDSMKESNNELVLNVQRILSKFTFGNWRIILLAFFPYLTFFVKYKIGIDILNIKEQSFFRQILKTMIEERKLKPKDPPDFLQLLLNARLELQEELKSSTGVTVENRLTMSESEIMSQCFIFLVAGYDTTASGLSFLLYLLALHPEVQDRCYQEIKAASNNDGNLVYLNICYTQITKALQKMLNFKTNLMNIPLRNLHNKLKNPFFAKIIGRWETTLLEYDLLQQQLPYLEAAIYETLRLFPAAARIDRMAKQPYKTKNFIIPANMGVSVPIYAIHYSANLYPEPEKFKPERFLKEERQKRHPLSFLSFGYGNRNCIGMRLALLQIKMAVSASLYRYKFVISDDTTKYEDLQLDSAGFIKTKEPLFLKVERRN